MTREEAINKIRQWSLPKETRDILEALAPELRENEDENLKNKSGYYKAGKFWKASTLWNATKNKVPQRVSNRYSILRECTWNIRSLQDFAKEVKNVQEVSLDYPIILDMNGNILDGAHRVVKAYLEDKDIDIVYLGDNEWPEPDYDEEKAVRGSNDERVRKSLIEFLTVIKAISESGRTAWAVRKEDAEMCKSFIAWLEKQKEPENVSASTMIPSCWEVKQEEQKPVPFSCGHEKGAKWSKEDEEMLDYVISDVNDAKQLFTTKEAIDLCDEEIAWLKSLPEKFNLQSKQECSKVTINGEPISTENQSVDISLAEWSEEDKKMLNHLIDKIQENLNIRMPDGYSFGISNDEKETFSSWLRCLPERFNLQPNQEWSDEDESSLKELIHYFESLLDCLATEKRHAENRKWLKFLKSLRPQYHGDVTMTEAYKMGFEAGKASSWKPSKEQMDSLRDTIANTKGYSYSIYLLDLYEQLKKLV